MLPRRGYGREWIWALLAQGLSSAATLVLTVLAARRLGAESLGALATGLAAFYLIQTVPRSLIWIPLASTSATSLPDERLRATGSALTSTIGLGLTGAVIMGAAGVAVSGAVGTGLVVIAPWVPAALLQAFMRTVLFRDARGPVAALADAAALTTLVLGAVTISERIGGLGGLVASWGLGAVVSSATALAVVKPRVSGVRAAARWFARVAAPLGRWLLLLDGTAAALLYIQIVALTAVLGAESVGGLRAAESVFAPFTLLAPAVLLAGIPALARAIGDGWHRAMRLAWTVSALAAAFAAVYGILAVALRDGIVSSVFGEEFDEYAVLAVPMFAWQLMACSALGFFALLFAAERGRDAFVVSLVSGLATLVASVVFASEWGVVGATVGYAMGAVVSTPLLIFALVRRQLDGAAPATGGGDR